MPSLQTLKDKWFLDIALKGQFPPQTRHPGSQLQPHTDGNLVEPVIDGAPLMAEFYRRTQAIINASNPSDHELWLAQWKLTPVQLLGETNPVTDAETQVLNVAKSGAGVYFLGSGHTGQIQATTTFAKKLLAAGGYGACDKRLPLYGSQHQKFYIFRGPDNAWLALLGSADFNYSRWDAPGHAADNPDRSPLGEGPSHDASVRVQGPAVHDIALTFTERWNDAPARTFPPINSAISTEFLNTPIPPQGPHSVQVLRTYGIRQSRAYSWSSQGEFTVWAAYLKAIKNAAHYIYIEDQYFYPFDEPPAFAAPAGNRRNSDIVYQLGEALKRGVDVIVLVPSRKGNKSPTVPAQLHARSKAAAYLQHISQTEAGAGRFLICCLGAGDVDPVIHSKLMLIDDEFTLLGSANVCRRSMTNDAEIHLGIVDAENHFTRNLRQALWQEHLDLTTPDAIFNYHTGFDYFQTRAVNQTGRLRLWPPQGGRGPRLYHLAMRFIDPYQGPKRDE